MSFTRLDLSQSETVGDDMHSSQGSSFLLQSESVTGGEQLKDTQAAVPRRNLQHPFSIMCVCECETQKHVDPSCATWLQSVCEKNVTPSLTASVQVVLIVTTVQCVGRVGCFVASNLSV